MVATAAVAQVRSREPVRGVVVPTTGAVPPSAETHAGCAPTVDASKLGSNGTRHAPVLSRLPATWGQVPIQLIGRYGRMLPAYGDDGLSGFRSSFASRM